MSTESFTISTADGGRIAATLRPAPRPVGVVVLHPAAGVTQAHYTHFARYLRGLGLSALTYDYRGMGASRPGEARDETVTMADWLLEDAPAVTRWAAERFPELPLLAVGHGVGGQALVLSGEGKALHGAVLVASHAGTARTIRGAGERARVWLAMRLLAPLLCTLRGYMPRGHLGLGEDLPRGVMLQWSRWSRLRRYFYDDPGLKAKRRAAAVRMPLLVLGFEDDPWATPRAIDLLMAGVKGAPVERRQIDPRAFGVQEVGQLGFFRKRSSPLWLDVGGWLLARAGAPLRSAERRSNSEFAPWAAPRAA